MSDDTMPLTLHLHPLSSYCWKALIALYEGGVAFDRHQLDDLRDPAQAAALRRLWPIGKFPVLTAGDEVIGEVSIIIEWLAMNFESCASLLPADRKAALEIRRWDRLIDLHVHSHVQKIVGDRNLPTDKRDAFGVDDAKRRAREALAVVDARMRGREWIAGDAFSMADCAAAPALFYANKITPLEGEDTQAYLERLKSRPSFARALEEAAPYFAMFPAG